MKSNFKAIEYARKIIQKTNAIVVFTGAGISTESGIPDFRSPGGLWTRFDPMKYANYDTFLKLPQFYWELERELTILVDKANPNAAHYALLKLEEQGKLKAVITQNIDMLHQKVGHKVPIFELHGSSFSGKCLMCGDVLTRSEILHKMDTEIIPKCNKCNGLIKTNTVLFNEKMPEHTWQGAINALEEADCLIVVGSSLEVSPANFLPYIANEKGIKLIYVNDSETILDDLANVCVRGKAGEILPLLVVP